MKRWSLRARLIFWSALVAAVVIVLFSVGVAWSLHHRLLHNLDRGLKIEAKAFFDALEKHSVDWSQRQHVEYLFEFPKNPRYIEVTKIDGTMLYRSENLKERMNDEELSDEDTSTIRLGKKEIRFGRFERGDIVLSIGQDTKDIHKTVTSLLSAYAFALPIVILAVGAGSWWVSRQALAPIETIIDRANKITVQRLDERLPIPQAQDEIGRLTLVLNTMFDRLEGSFQQVARFTSDASHELRTPLTIMRGEIEAAIQSGSFNPDQEKVLLSLLEETTHLSKITTNLLLLSRADAGKLQLQISQVDVSALTNEIVEVMEIAAEARSVFIRTEITPNVVIASDSDQLRQVLLNLLDNAIKYNFPRGTVMLKLDSTANGAMELYIRNTGSGIPPESAQLIFQRFYRGESSHHSQEDGHGLGLSICREIARALGGSLDLIRSDEAWTEFRLFLPNTFSETSGKL